ncbi:phenoloxidase 1-like [Phymastichus coffea]|uniref:phenoloxidase 1-like n=1 Tax=Phymastichus coffea TaxID=108790 RepID=UPI00273B5416|nr:phenoloxidase 1-like [Phymastichus coffea]
MERNLLLLFDRPHEPVYVPKGEQKVSFEIPADYLPEKYQPIGHHILTRFGGDAQSSVPIKQIAIPDLSVPLSLSRRDGFSLFLSSHRKMAARLTELFMTVGSVEELLSLAVYCRDRMNAGMFVYSLSVAMLHRPDTKHLPIPQLAEVFPDKYMDSSIFHVAKEEANVVPSGSRSPIEIPLNYTATDADAEHRVAYWREDIGINLHHWHWHLVYPFEGPRVAVDKDRRGELFYYVHHQIMARYNVERLCNSLPRSRRLANWREPIPEAYFPKLDSMVAGRAWPARPAGFVLSDVNRPGDNMRFDISDMERYRDRIMEAIHTRSVRSANGSLVQLDEVTGIDVLGNIMEASTLSPDLAYYGDLHNMGHVAISFCHDPDNRFLEPFSIMGDATTAMRDPAFYRWHEFIDGVFYEFLDSLPAYSAQQLTFPNVTVSDARINSPGANPNTLNTYWSKSDVDLSRGLDFTPRGSIMARLTHLNHDDFSYSLTINNSTNQTLIGTVRVFFAAKYDETGRHLNYNEQRLLMIEMDKFTARLNRGQNTIIRNSNESSVTIPFEATFRDLNTDRPSPNNIQAFDRFNFCGCGWPQHMLVPKGTKQGYPMDMFIMVSNYDVDKVNQPDPTGCRDGVSFCGLRDLKYPDKRPMGYPFDRVARPGVTTLNEFLTPNMKVQQITVRFTDTIKPRQSSISQSTFRL